MNTQTLIHVLRLSLIVLGITIMLSLSSCSNQLTKLREDTIVLVPSGSVDDRPTFDVYSKGKLIMEHMYTEEISLSIKEGKWQYNEMATIESH